MKDDIDRIQGDSGDSNSVTRDENRDPIAGAPGTHPLGMEIEAAASRARAWSNRYIRRRQTRSCETDS